MSQDQLMPWESSEAPGLSESEANEAMFDALGPEFDDEGEPQERGEQPDPEDDQGDDPEAFEDDEFEDDEGEESDEDDEIEAEETEDDESEDELFEVKIDGKIERVPLDELKAGYSRTQDYTRKTQELSAERQQELQRLGETRSQYEQRLEMAEQFIQSQLPQRPSDQLRKENPGEYAAQMEDWRNHVGQLQAIQAERDRVVREQQQEWANEQAQHLQQEQAALRKAVPEWKDDSALQQGLSDLQSYLQSEYGYTDVELSGVTDHRALLIARKAAEYDKMMAEGDKKLKKAPKKDKPLEPGARTRKAPSKAAKKRTKRALDRLEQTGSVNDAAAALLASGALDD